MKNGAKLAGQARHLLGFAGAGAAILAVVLFGRETAAQWVEAVWQFFTTGGGI